MTFSPASGWSPGSSTAPTDAPSAAPTEPPTPEGELFVYNWADYMGENVVPCDVAVQLVGLDPPGDEAAVVDHVDCHDRAAALGDLVHFA